jgi:hypothetical protein
MLGQQMGLDLNIISHLIGAPSKACSASSCGSPEIANRESETH